MTKKRNNIIFITCIIHKTLRIVFSTQMTQIVQITADFFNYRKKSAQIHQICVICVLLQNAYE